MSELEAIRASIDNLGKEIRSVREEDVRLATERHIETQARLATIETTLRLDDVQSLYERVDYLESWRSELVGRGRVINGVSASLIALAASVFGLVKGCAATAGRHIAGHP